MKKVTKILSAILLVFALTLTIYTGGKKVAWIDPPIGSPSQQTVAWIDPPIGSPSLVSPQYIDPPIG